MGMNVGGKKGGAMADINVTPLVDVVLVLLIIFMVVTPELEAGAAVDLPAAANVDKGEENSLTPTTVSLTAQGALFIDKHEVPRAQLVEKLRGVFEKDPQARFAINQFTEAQRLTELARTTTRGGKGGR